jgi:catechol 2,3-dioxygenase-like lactoylglutathione lyase family enzyme
MLDRHDGEDSGQYDQPVIDAEWVDFVSLPTRDIGRARTFYTELLGLRPSSSSVSEVEAGNVTLSFWNPEQDGEDFQPFTAGIALRVADVERAREQLEEAGVEFLGDTVDTGVCHMAFLRDPDGNTVILHRRYAPRS